MIKLFSEFAQLLEKDRQPWYVAVTPCENTKWMLTNVQNNANIPNPLSASKMHCTLIYSRQPCLYPSVQRQRLHTATLDKFTVFHTRDGKNCLVAKLNSVDLQQRHRELMTEMEASYDFDDYLPHITLSYDIGDWDWSALKTSDVRQQFYLTDEYCTMLEDLD